jgi:hypothetical protein
MPRRLSASDTGRVDHHFTLDEARSLLAEIRGSLDTFIEQRAAFAELRWALDNDPASADGGVAELKAFDARLDALLAALRDHDIQVKGIAPLLLDFPATLDGQSVLLCWLEGDDALAWYHRTELGFMGRRPL